MRVKRLTFIGGRTCCFSFLGSVIKIWHKRLGHYHHQALLLLQTKTVSEGLPNFGYHLPHCQACQFGK